VDPAVYGMTMTNVAPRVGFFYQPKILPNAVVRAGWGLYYTSQENVNAQYSIVSQVITINNSVSNTQGVPTYVMGVNAMPAVTVGQITQAQDNAMIGAVQYLSTHQHSPYVNQYNLDFQYSFAKSFLADVAYLGNTSRHLAVNWNPFDCSSTLIVTGLGPMNGAKWNEGLLTSAGGSFDLLSLHFNHDAAQNPTPDFMAAAAYALPFAVGPHFDKVQAQIDAHGLHGKVHQAITEWLFNSKGLGERNFTDESPSWRNEGGTVMAAGFLNTVLRRADQIALTDMTGSQEFAGIWKRREQVYAVPAYYAFKMYSAVKGDAVLSVDTDSGTYDMVGGVRPLDNEKGIPTIYVVATRSADGSTLTLLCVNRSWERDEPVRFDLGALKIAGLVNAEQIKAASRYEMNDEVEPVHVVPQPITLTAPAAGPITMTLPHESVTVIRVAVK